MLENVSVNTTIGELCENSELKFMSEYIFTHMTDDVWKNTIDHYGNEKCGIIPALERMKEIASEQRQTIYSVYSKEQIQEQPELNDVKLIHMPGEAGKPFVLVCPGGGYAREWVLVEGYPIGEQLNRMGYTAFILIYRTGQKPLFPKPAEDVAQALRFIQNNREKFQILMNGYAVAGFSAGGHLAAEWGTKNVGYKKYEIEKPAALILGYPAISNEVFYESLQSSTNPVFKESMENYLERVAGIGYSKESLQKYSVEYHIDEEYPPTYLIHCKDDPVVPVQSSYVMEENLKKYKISYKTEFVQQGGHSLGLGNGTQADGWLKRAVKFWEKFL